MSENPSADELVRRVLEGAMERTLAFVLGRRVPVAVTPAPDGLPSGMQGITITLTALDGRRPAIVAFPSDTWSHWSTVGDLPEKSVMLLFTGALDRWQLLAHPGDPTPSFTFPGLWNAHEGTAWTRTSGQYFWFQVRTATHSAWVGLDPKMRRIGQRLLLEPEFRSRLREDVLGEACGRVGATRAWESATRQPLKLGESFVLGPCLLPVFGTGEEALVPKFFTADPDAKPFNENELLFLYHFGWDGQTFTVVYRPQVLGDLHDWEDLDHLMAGRLLPFASLVERPADAQTWEQARALPSTTENWLVIHAQHIPQGPVWDIFLPAELLNALSVSGLHPWNWTWLSAGADNLLHVFLQINDRFRLGPPAGFAERAGLDWSVGWYAQTGQSSPPAVGMTLADLLVVASTKDKVLLIQNVLVPSAHLHPLQGLFTWSEEDPEAGIVGFQLAGFDRAGFRTLLPPAALVEWDADGLAMQTREQLRDRNTEALEAVWDAWRRGRVELSQPTVEVLRVGFAQVQKAWRERKARERTGAGIGPLLERLAGRKDLGAILQRPGPRGLALALLYDAEGLRLVNKLCTRRFSQEFLEQSRLWSQQFLEDGPELEMFQEARDRIEKELIPVSS